MPKKTTLLYQLKKSLTLLEHRKMMIPSYCDQSKSWSGKNHYSLDMIPELDKEIAEMKAAIQGIKHWKRSKKK
jgi:hypothetical protein